MDDYDGIFGIDYGSQLAGNTVLAFTSGSKIQIFQSEKKKSSDDFLMSHIVRMKPASILIDAPLSLPGVYSGMNNKHDYFYREADRETRAMSPMFLGGLTARAMKLSFSILNLYPETIILEAYPAACAANWLDLDKIYKKDLLSSVEILSQTFRKYGFNLAVDLVPNWHCLDALLVLYIGFKVKNRSAFIAGDPEEGLIFF